MRVTVLPTTEDALVLRTDFTDDEAWSDVCDAIQVPEPEHGFRAYVQCVSDPAYDGLTVAALTGLATHGPYHGYVFVVDSARSGSAIACACGRSERRAGSHLPGHPGRDLGRENNLSIANMDFAEFADATGPDGVFRGFPGPPPDDADG